MGDDAELWMESGGDPTTLITDDDWWDGEPEKSSIMKKNTMIFIDAESISANHCSKIIGQCKGVGEIYEARYYALQNDNSTVAWKSMAKQYSIKPILMYGAPEHNKIDNKIIKDIKRIVETNKSIDIFCIASRDGDYCEIVEYLRKRKKRVVILATKNTSKRLKGKASEIKGI